MDQTSLNAIWKRVAESGDQVEGLVGRQGRHQDFLVDLSEGRLWSRSHEIGVWVEATSVRDESELSPVRRRSHVGRHVFVGGTPAEGLTEPAQRRQNVA